MKSNLQGMLDEYVANYGKGREDAYDREKMFEAEVRRAARSEEKEEPVNPEGLINLIKSMPEGEYSYERPRNFLKAMLSNLCWNPDLISGEKVVEILEDDELKMSEVTKKQILRKRQDVVLEEKKEVKSSNLQGMLDEYVANYGKGREDAYDREKMFEAEVRRAARSEEKEEPVNPEGLINLIKSMPEGEYSYERPRNFLKAMLSNLCWNPDLISGEKVVEILEDDELKMSEVTKKQILRKRQDVVLEEKKEVKSSNLQGMLDEYVANYGKGREDAYDREKMFEAEVRRAARSEEKEEPVNPEGLINLIKSMPEGEYSYERPRNFLKAMLSNLCWNPDLISGEKVVEILEDDELKMSEVTKKQILRKRQDVVLEEKKEVKSSNLQGMLDEYVANYGKGREDAYDREKMFEAEVRRAARSEEKEEPVNPEGLINLIKSMPEGEYSYERPRNFLKAMLSNLCWNPDLISGEKVVEILEDDELKMSEITKKQILRKRQDVVLEEKKEVKSSNLQGMLDEYVANYGKGREDAYDREKMFEAEVRRAARSEEKEEPVNPEGLINLIKSMPEGEYSYERPRNFLKAMLSNLCWNPDLISGEKVAEILEDDELKMSEFTKKNILKRRTDIKQKEDKTLSKEKISVLAKDISVTNEIENAIEDMKNLENVKHKENEESKDK